MSSQMKAAPMTKQEVMLLIQLVAVNKTILTSKEMNAASNRLKEEAWQNLTNNFNASISSFPRSRAQLRLKWENLKKAARKRYSNMINSHNTVGGRKDYFPPDEVLDKVTSLLSSANQNVSVEYGGDVSPQAHMILGEVTVESEELIEQSDGEGPYEEEVIKEMNYVETPPPKKKKIFSSRPNKIGILANRKHMMEEEKCKARISRENALAEYLLAKKRKLDLENEEKEIFIAKLKLELENAKLENLKLKSELLG